jgi:hypothetical protein
MFRKIVSTVFWVTVAVMAVSWLETDLPGYAQSEDSGSRETIRTPMWEFSFERGLPTKETVTLMYNALDFQRAVEGYIWATPMLYLDEWRRQMKEQTGLDYGDVAIWDNFCDPHTVGLTPNDTTIYAATHLATGFSDHAQAGERSFEMSQPRHI